MVISSISRTAWLVAVGITSLFSIAASRSEACEPSKLLGRVKSVVVTEEVIDPATGKILGVRNAFRLDISEDGAVATMALGLAGRQLGPAATSTTYYENGRPVRGFQTSNGKTVPSMTCSYDAQGRLAESRTGSENSEFAITETYEYGPSVITRRTNSIPGGRSVTTQTLDAEGRVVKEVVVDEATSTVQRATETRYAGNRETVCDASGGCATTVKDARGNEIEFLQRNGSRKTAIEYDSAGNWISKRTTDTFLGAKTERIVRRKIEYW